MGNAFQHAAGIGGVVIVAAVVNGVHNAAAVGSFNNKLNFSAGGVNFFARMVDGFGIRHGNFGYMAFVVNNGSLAGNVAVSV